MPGGKPFQSKLTPFYDLIARLRNAHTPYPQIAQLLRDEHGLEVAASTIFEFVKVRARRSGVFALPERPGSAAPVPAPSPLVNEAHGTAQAAKKKVRTVDAGGSRKKSATPATSAAAAKKSTSRRPSRPSRSRRPGI